LSLIIININVITLRVVVDDNWTVLYYYAERSTNFLQTFWDNVAVTNSRDLTTEND